MTTTEAGASPTAAADTPPEHVDVVVVGAGLSGVGIADQLQSSRPGSSYLVLEARERLGGTWDLFRYPGIRSDSDMMTLGYRRRPWPEASAIADGPAIRDYVARTADEQGITDRVRFSRKVTRAEWSSADARWTLTVERTDAGAGPGSDAATTETLTCRFLVSASGYYRYDAGYTPDFAGVEDFAGTVVHPQQWPEDLDTTGRDVVVIGSGATAVTLVPALAPTARSVTMLQRSPSYVLAVPRHDALGALLRRVLPARAATTVVRWKNIAQMKGLYGASRRWPRAVRRLLLKQVTAALPPGFDVATHFTPTYDPWDQRLCFVPDGDLFRAIREDGAQVVTDHVDRFTPTGVRLRSGRELPADVVVTATGLELLALGGITLVVDGSPVSLPETVAYKSLMLAGVPNFAFALGYTNASWTLKVDLVAEYVVRLLDHLDAGGWAACAPVADASVPTRPLLDFAAGYVQRSIGSFPVQGETAPWSVTMRYLTDRKALRRGSVTEHMRFFGRR
ncbi:NAD(P)/FAD-dependent oxidoreductase [Rhodococcus aerolatus]